MLSGLAYSQNLYCTGKLQHVHVVQNGDVRLKTDYKGDPIGVCNVETKWKNEINPETCKAWLSASYMALASNRDIKILFKGVSVTECSKIPSNNNAPVVNALYVQ
ncbi:Uncharacterised protein [BD1-7 clade bacterium]|uniref:Uncharacterized protein n=1 Tax=BD1-7 clade bacterium TaxID=2029982 RepID=A0A5S9Q8E7_9GAMM|nr:Uncharacterised protein [BD1-7 clade bacterium]